MVEKKSEFFTDNTREKVKKKWRRNKQNMQIILERCLKKGIMEAGNKWK
jgi:hypothetical protein